MRAALYCRNRLPFRLYMRTIDGGVSSRARHTTWFLLASAFLFAVTLGPVLLEAAADPFYFGNWKIVSASVAPWWPYVERSNVAPKNVAPKNIAPKAPLENPDPSEMKELSGKIVGFTAKGITGPPQAACPHPRYRVVKQPAEGLFQGMFAEMHDHDKSVDARQVAASVGFRGSSWKTLETGCGNELDFHFLDDNHMAFGLNNYIYMLQRQ